jgi:DNA-binding Lrp family transcriptional regulator
MATPPARDLLHLLREHLLILDRELAADCEVMKCSRSTDNRDVEAGQIPAASAAVTGGRHVATLASSSVLAMVHAFVLIDAEPARIADLATELADVDHVAEVYSVAGEADLVAVVRVRQHDELAEVVTRSIASLDGILNTRTMIAFQAHSRHDLEAMWDLGAS